MSRNRRRPRPAGAPVPQDHKPGKDASEVLRVDALGRTWVIPAERLDDDEFMELVGRLQDGDPFVAPRIGRMLLGDDDYETARGLLRNPDTGRVKASDMLEFVGAILQGG